MNKRGFTLIELLVTLAVAVILATIAVPSFQSLLERNQFAVEYNEVLSGLLYARSEAVTRREKVTATVTQDNGNWRLAVTDSASPANELLVKKGADEKVTVPIGSITYNSLGRRDSCSEWENCKVTITGASLSASMAINVAGRVEK